MALGGRTCKPVERGDRLASEPFDVEVGRDQVFVRFRGRLVRTLTGADADAVRAVLDDPDQLQRVVARKTGNVKRGER